MTSPEYFELISGDKIPAIGYGSGTAWARSKPQVGTPIYDTLVTAMVDAVKAGFRHLDTAEMYDTHPEVGAAIALILKEGIVKREDLWVTDKFHCGFETGYIPRTSGPYESLKLGLSTMKLDYVDLYLLHSELVLLPGENLASYWAQMEKLKSEGLAKNIGISNFSSEKLNELYELATIKPSVLQIEYQAYLQNQSPGVVQFAKEKKMVVEAYGPLNPLTKAKGGPLDDLVEKLSVKYGRSNTLILLRWVYQTGVLPLTTTTKVERMEDVLQIFDFSLDEEDMRLITETGKGHFFRGSIPHIFGKYDEELKKSLGLSE
ncbi:unnamed protein product [Kuraishia capsulata CBS 1993]|uniref:NADP-dependent oxidoreductase domain-containing protein n=1 Tax=Kuraishia capsulata CBS 1993 TaxID=1382522 RepID=W6MXR2_9ASCO|nr:uncharacterized protein KUCA_T00005323001 [Kuraishia capsulata CBS 1993]CDK29335.1 unnamed protein product [Kuraishia capsulata CBS 1993]